VEDFALSPFFNSFYTKPSKQR